VWSTVNKSDCIELSNGGKTATSSDNYDDHLVIIGDKIACGVVSVSIKVFFFEGLFFVVY
jgi:hypothetical protein